MPEIGEIARAVHYIRKYLVGKTITSVRVQEDNIVYGKAGTTASMFQEAVAGKKVLSAGQQGKYFWMELSSPPHPLLHASMTGWMKYSNVDSSFYNFYKPKEDEPVWPPRFWKFILATDDDPSIEAAFVDPRRLGRIRLLDCAGKDIRKTSPLSENGPDPVQDKDIVTEEWFAQRVKSKRVPIKAFFLDQAMLSGVGNWVADEVLFQARVHPEQYTNALSDEQLKRLHQALLHVCSVAVETLADSEKYPENWLVKYRWGKGKGKKESQLPTGEKITFLTVGGRTSAVVPSLQKKTGPVAQDVEEPEDEVAVDKEDDAGKNGAEAKNAKKKGGSRSKRRATAQAEADVKSEGAEDDKPPSKKRKSVAKAPKAEASVEGRQTRRSARLSKYFEE